MRRVWRGRRRPSSPQGCVEATQVPSMDLRLGHGGAGLQEIEVAAVVGLADVLLVHAAVAALVARRRAASTPRGGGRARRPTRADGCAGPSRRPRSRRRFRPAPAARRRSSPATRAGCRRRSWCRTCARPRCAACRARRPSRASSGSAACPIPACRARPSGPAFCSTSMWSGVTSRSSRSISRGHVVVVAEHDRRAAMLSSGAARRRPASSRSRAARGCP